MPRTLKTAAIQMDAAPAPTAQRLERAERLIAQAAQAGAQLIALPELFNAGYRYDDSNYARAEPLTGVTVTWMQAQAARHQVHLAGTLLLLDGDHVYNSALLIAPDGRQWRYDKQYPFAWERAYFREGSGITVAETDLGRIGLLICWDTAHPDAWARYAGRVDLMLVLSSPPCLNDMRLCFADGTRERYTTPDAHFADADMEAQAGWLGVPVVHASGIGQFRSPAPLATASLGLLLLAQPRLWSRLGQAGQAQLEAEYGFYTRIMDGSGEVLARVTHDGDSFTLAAVTLPDQPHVPQTPQPVIHTTPFAYWSADVASALFIPLYQQGLRRQWGTRMAPTDARTFVWGMGLLLALLLGWLIGRRQAHS